MSTTIAVVSAFAGGIAAYSSMKAQEKQVDYQNQQIASQNAYNERQAVIDAQWYTTQLGFADELKDFALQQQAFAFKMQAYGEKTYQVALRNAQMQHQYQVESLNLKKQAARTQYNADVHVADVMKLGASEQAKNAVGEVLRVGSTNVRHTDKQLIKAQGKLNATLLGGITGGDAAERAAVEAFMARNDAVANIKNDSIKSIIDIANQKNKVINDFSLKVAQSKRELQGILALTPPPMPIIPPPRPVFTGLQPVAPVKPPGAVPGETPDLPSPSKIGGYANIVTSVIGGASAGYALGKKLG